VSIIKLYNKQPIFISLLLTNTLFVSIYFFLVKFSLNAPFWGSGLLAPITGGIILGVFSGILYTQRNNKQRSLYHALEQQSVLKEISLLPHQQYDLEEVLNKTISLILSVSFCKLQSKGGIFLTSQNNVLELKSHVNLSESVLNNCGKKGIKVGECLCGLAAQNKKTIYKQTVDHEHSTQHDDMEDHGHYNVPILHENEVLGVIVVYVDTSHKESKEEVDFLESVANLLSLIIRKYTTDKKVRDSEIALKETQKFAGLGSWSLNITTGTLNVSEEAFAILDTENNGKQLTENDFIEKVHPLDLPEMELALKQAKKGIPFEIEIRFIKKDGTIAHIINKCKPISVKNHIKELSGTLLNVSKLRDNEAKLVENQKLVNGILRATPDMLYLVDLDTNEFVYCNAVMEKTVKKVSNFKERFKEKGIALFKEYAHPDDLEILKTMDKKLRSGDDFFSVIFRSNALGNKYRWIEQRVFVFNRSKDGIIHKLLIISKDIHEKMCAEKSIKKLNKRLLKQYQDIKKVNTELDHFVYSVSHDLRSPLSSILGLVNLGKFTFDPQPLKEYLTRIGISINKLDEFIKEILDYSRNSRTEVETDSIDVDALITELFENIRLLKHTDINLELNTTQKITYVCDKRRLSIVLNNILSNACKYADKDKARKYVKVEVLTSHDGCTFTIEDNGIGIKKERQDKVFNMFYRGTETSDGSGLGLFIVKETLAKLKGTINLESEEGVGTRIVLKLPHTSSLRNPTKRHKKTGVFPAA